MAKKVFWSFHFKGDNARVSQIRNIGAVQGQPILSGNDWEAVKKKGDKAIEEWIDGQLNYKDCTIVLIGAGTAGRKWVEYEIKKTWNRKKGLMGIYIHNLKDLNGNQSVQGANPFGRFTLDNGHTDFASVVPVYNPPYSDSKFVYNYISNNIENWVDNAIANRSRYA